MHSYSQHFDGYHPKQKASHSTSYTRKYKTHNAHRDVLVKITHELLHVHVKCGLRKRLFHLQIDLALARVHFQCNLVFVL